MKKMIFAIIVSLLVLSLVGCSSAEVIDEHKLNNPSVGIKAFIDIGEQLYYDATTGIVYIWNGYCGLSQYATMPTPYYAPNGLPYKYNPETNVLYEIAFEQEKE